MTISRYDNKAMLEAQAQAGLHREAVGANPRAVPASVRFQLARRPGALPLLLRRHRILLPLTAVARRPHRRMGHPLSVRMIRFDKTGDGRQGALALHGRAPRRYRPPWQVHRRKR
jgi:hypothetical protein